MVRLLEQRSADRLPTFPHHCVLSVSIDQLSKADTPLFPKAYIDILSMQCLVSLSDGLVGYTFPPYNTLVVQKPPAGSTEPMHAPGPLNLTMLRCCPKPSQLRTVHAMLTQAGPRFLQPSPFSLPQTSQTPFSVTS